MNIPTSIIAGGRFSLIKHTGHKFDAGGRLVELGQPLSETPLAPNTFFPIGGSFAVSEGPNVVTLGVGGAGSAVPLIESSSLVSAAVSRSTVAGADGRAWWRKTYRFSFPAVPGGGAVTLFKGFARVTGGPLQGGVTTGIVSVADLVPGVSGVVVDRATESFDLVWQYTEYFRLTEEGSLTVRTFDGLGRLLEETAHSYELRPANIDNVDTAGDGWFASDDASFCRMPTASTSFVCGLGTIGSELEEPVFSESLPATDVSPVVPSAAGGGSSVVATFGFDSTTTEEVNCARIFLGHTDWQVQFTPPIQKKSSHQMKLSFDLRLADRAE